MVNWVLVFFMAGQPQDYKIHTAYIKQENCITAQERYRGIFTTTNSKMQAECRPRNQVQVGRQSSVVYKKYRLED